MELFLQKDPQKTFMSTYLNSIVLLEIMLSDTLKGKIGEEGVGCMQIDRHIQGPKQAKYKKWGGHFP